MNLPRLNATTTPNTKLPQQTGIVHLGLGSFHRAHQATYTAAALTHTDGPWGILGIASRSSKIVTALREQNLRYSVVELTPHDVRITVPAVHTSVLVGAQQPDAVLDAIAAPDTAIVTLTVTETGYTYSPRTHRLDFDNPAVQADLHGRPPQTTIGQLTRALQRRLRAHASPITILSCDNLTSNGNHTAQLVREFAHALPANEQNELTTWLEKSVTFPNTMVDRIVPATTDEHRTVVAQQLGLRDAVPVPAEPFTMWVLEDRFATSRPRWEHGGARFTTDVTPYELLKLRLLNGTHSLIAYLGALSGCGTISASIAQPFVAEAARHVIHDDYLPTVPVPADIDIDDYAAQLFQRWSNTALGHQTRQVGSDGSTKLAQRVPEAALHHLRAGRIPQHLALTVATYLCCMTPLDGFDAGPHAAAMADPARTSLTATAERSRTTKDFVTNVLQSGLLGHELAERSEFIDRIAEFVDIITTHGPAAAAAAANDQLTTA